jgi:hypothetical protein
MLLIDYFTDLISVSTSSSSSSSSQNLFPNFFSSDAEDGGGIALSRTERLRR